MDLEQKLEWCLILRSPGKRVAIKYYSFFVKIRGPIKYVKNSQILNRRIAQILSDQVILC